MKTETLNVSLPTELAEFARQDMSFGAYGRVKSRTGCRPKAGSVNTPIKAGSVRSFAGEC